MIHVWWFRKWPRTTWDSAGDERKGQPCRVLARGVGGGPRNVLVEFEDGEKMVSTRFAVRAKCPNQRANLAT